MPPETGLGSAILAVRLGERLGLHEEALAATYYAAITRFLGCTATSAEAASFALSEDQALYLALAMCDWTDADEVQAAVDRHIAPDAPTARRREAFRAIREAHEAIPSIALAHCTQAMVLAERLPVPAGVPALLSHIYDLWDGLVPGSAGDAIPLPAQIISLAAAAEAFRRAGGVPAAIEMLRSRAGRHFDPELCRLLERDASALFEGFAAASHWERWLDAEPGEPIRIESEGVDDVAEACALDADAANALRRAALVHDIGRAAVANGIWDKPGPLTRMERARMQSHPYHTALTLASTDAFAGVSDLASMAHERCDGSGYHRRLHLSDPCGSLLADAVGAVLDGQDTREARPGGRGPPDSHPASWRSSPTWHRAHPPRRSQRRSVSRRKPPATTSRACTRRREPAGASQSRSSP